MVILYNPRTGSKIEGFVYGGKGELEPHGVGELKQYEPQVAKVLQNTFNFLEVKTPEQAQSILEEKKNIKCEKCEVTFKPEAEVALEAHMKKHQEDEINGQQPAIDPGIVPIAGATPVESNKSLSERVQQSLIPDLPAEQGFYGPGLVSDKG